MDAVGIPLDVLVLVLVVIVMPICVVVCFGLFAFKGLTPLAYRCRRCGGEFRRKSYRGFPACCPRCRAPDWNT